MGRRHDVDPLVHVDRVVMLLKPRSNARLQSRLIAPAPAAQLEHLDDERSEE